MLPQTCQQQQQQRAAVCTTLSNPALEAVATLHFFCVVCLQVLVGPVSVRPPHATISPPEVAQFLAGSHPSAGFILVAFGSSAHFAAQISAEEYSQLALAFADLAPSKVLWNVRALPHKLSSQDLPLGNNTLLAPWVDYNDALGHPNCKAFVTHAGIHSIYEAAFHGVPAVGVPFMDEQLANAVALAGRGMAEVAVEAVGMRKKGRAGHGRQYTRQYMAGLIKQVSSAAALLATSRV